MKKLLFVLAIATAFVACNNNVADQAKETTDSAASAATSKMSDIADSAKSKIDSTVSAAKDTVKAKMDSMK